MSDATGGDQGQPDPPHRAGNEHLQRLLDALMGQRGVHHAVIAVESLDGAFRWSGCAGDARPGGVAMSVETPFFIASITKLYIATTVLRMCEQGSVSLDAPVSTYLPPHILNGLHAAEGVDHTPAITVRHLLSHTSGLPDYLEERPGGEPSLVERLATEGDMEWGLEDVASIVRRLSPHFHPQPVDAPRPRARYSDTNFRLLIAIIETVTGLPFQQALQDTLFRPLDLQRTWLAGRTPPPAAPEPAALWFMDEPLEIPRALRSAGDLYSTVEDTLAFLRALVCGRVFSDPATLAAMHGNWVRFGVPRDRAALRSPGWPVEYGLGVMRYRLPRLFTPRRPMPLVTGHTGSTGCWLFYCPDRELLLAGSVDQMTAGAVPFRVVPRILNVLAVPAAGREAPT